MQSTAVIAPPAWDSEERVGVQSTAVLPREESAIPLDPHESDADWEARVLRACAPRVLGLRD
jgi:hypothetical protein